MKMEIKIYLVTCTPTGKKYIGITTKTLKRRWIQHRSHAKQKTGFIFHKAINYYGPEAFTIEHLASAFNWTAACELEKFFIQENKTLHPNGYNTTEGGNGMDAAKLGEKMKKAHTGKKHTEATKLKMRAIHQEKLKDPVYRTRLSEGAKKRIYTEAQIQRFISCRQRVFTAEHRAKMAVGISRALKGKPFSEHHRLALRAAWAKKKEKRLATKFIALSSATLFRNYLNLTSGEAA